MTDRREVSCAAPPTPWPSCAPAGPARAALRAARYGPAPGTLCAGPPGRGGGRAGRPERGWAPLGRDDIAREPQRRRRPPATPHAARPARPLTAARARRRRFSRHSARPGGGGMGNTTLMALSALVGLVSSSGHHPTWSSGARSSLHPGESAEPRRVVPDKKPAPSSHAPRRHAAPRSGSRPRSRPPAIACVCADQVCPLSPFKSVALPVQSPDCHCRLDHVSCSSRFPSVGTVCVGPMCDASGALCVSVCVRALAQRALAPQSQCARARSADS